MNRQCLQQCHQCHHSAYSSAIKNCSFSQVNTVQCHQCHQFPTTQIHMRAHTHVSSFLSAKLMALMALHAAHLRRCLKSVALSVGTAQALVMALPFANPDTAGGAR